MQIQFCAEERYILLVDFFNIASTSGVDFVKISYLYLRERVDCVVLYLRERGRLTGGLHRRCPAPRSITLCLIRVSTKNIISSPIFFVYRR
jgi:hypothetical protein